MHDERVTITDFLLARISEDEIDLAGERDVDSHPFPQDPVHPEGPAWVTADGRDVTAEYDHWLSELPITKEAQRWQAECDAKRTIVELHPLTADVVPVDTGPTPGYGCETCHTVTAGRIEDVDYVEALGPCETLLALASVYADHPRFDPSWQVATS